jgi:DNA-binding GntR family transcriptional regulator
MQMALAETPRLAPVAPEFLRGLREHVHDALRSAIVAGRLRSGERLNERALSAQLGVSTTPVKEALRRLESEGLVRTEARRGVYVTFSPARALEMALARAAIESLMAHIAAKRVGAAEIASLGALVDEMAEATVNAALEDLVALNERFHGAIHAASGCDYLPGLIAGQSMYDRAQRLALLAERPERAKGLAEHRAIFDAIAAREPGRAEAAMRAHIVRSAKDHVRVVFGATDLGATYGD